MNTLIKDFGLKRGNTMKKIILALVFVMALASLAFADTIVLRDGRTIRGTLLGFVNGRFVVRVENRYTTNDQNIQRNRTNEGDIQYFRPEEIERIEIDGRTLDDGRSETSTVQVPLEANWIDTGINLRRNERVQVTATGVIMVGRTRITPDGLRSTDAGAPLPSAAEGELIGTVGDDSRSPIMELGSTREFTADRDGRLYLTANRSSYADARGSFTVQIKHERNTGETDRRPGRIRSRNRGLNDDFGRNRNQDVTINVPGTSRGTDTGIDVRAGESITFSATGAVIAGRRIGEVGPEGARTSGLGGIIGTRPVPTAGPGALIAYIRMPNGQLSQAYLIGSQLTTSVPTDGRLILAINDDDYSDNGGSFTVRIRY